MMSVVLQVESAVSHAFLFLCCCCLAMPYPESPIDRVSSHFTHTTRVAAFLAIARRTSSSSEDNKDAGPAAALILLSLVCGWCFMLPAPKRCPSYALFRIDACCMCCSCCATADLNDSTCYKQEVQLKEVSPLFASCYFWLCAAIPNVRIRFA